MAFVLVRDRREWIGVMPGDIVRDGSDMPWRVERCVIEPGSAEGDARWVAWVELRGGIGAREVRTIRCPDATAHVLMGEGPGWGPGAGGDAALHWAVELIGSLLGGTVTTTATPVTAGPA